MKGLTTATRKNIDIAGSIVEGLQLPDGTYRMSDADIAKAIGKNPKNAVPNFRASKAFESLRGNGSAVLLPPLKITTGDEGARSQANASTLEFAALFWAVNSAKNPKALALTVALATETIERRFDRAFNVEVSETERDDRLAQRRAEFYKSFAASLTVEDWGAGDKADPTPADVALWAGKVREVYAIPAAQGIKFTVEERDRTPNYDALMAEYD